MGTARVKRRRWPPWASVKTSHVEGRIVTPERDDERLRSLPVPNVLPPGQSRYQSHSAGLPSGVAVFRGLGANAAVTVADPSITVDLTVLETEDHTVDA